MTLFGYGKTTKAIAKKIGQATFYDDKVSVPFTNEDGFKLQPSNAFDPNYSHLEIPSPGIPPYHPLIQKAKNLVSEYDYFAKDMPFTVWISGTNGKTTTTQMMEHLLQDKGALSGGNIGFPLAQLNTHAPMWLLETSSYTLHYTNMASPNIYILLPISPDHISWHGSIQAYEEAKLKPLKTMQEGEIAIIPRAYDVISTHASVVYYDTLEDIASYFGLDQARIHFEGAFLMDALMAMAVDTILFDRKDYEKMNRFVLDPHRQEKLLDQHNRIWINDSKATNLDATIVLLSNYEKETKLHLILGGDDKGVDLNELFENLKKYTNMHLYLIGKNEPVTTALSTRFNIPFTPCSNLANAIDAIAIKHTSSSVALLSPAAASLDQFSSYSDRGDQFKKKVLNLS